LDTTYQNLQQLEMSTQLYDYVSFFVVFQCFRAAD